MQLGGPSGGCIPARLADTPIDYDALASTGAIMGSGGLVVLDEPRLHGRHRALLPALHAGRIVRQVHLLPHRHQAHAGDPRAAVRGRRPPGDLEKLEQLAGYVSRGSLCGLGQTAPNPVLTTLRYFREEYEAHLPRSAARPAAARR